MFPGAAPPARHLLGVLISQRWGVSCPGLRSSSVKWSFPSSCRALLYNECGGCWALGPGVATLLHRGLCSGLGSRCSPLPCSVLQSVLRGLGSVVSVEERSLTGTWNVSEMLRWTWSTRDPHRHRGSDALVLAPPQVPSLIPSQTPSEACVTWSWPSSFSGFQPS